MEAVRPSVGHAQKPFKQKTDIAIVGAGILGLAHALAAARRGLVVVLFERDERAVGASLRNFGLPWPVGLALTPLQGRALRSRAIWLEAARQAGFWLAENGALFLAYHEDEEAVLHEFMAAAAQDAARKAAREAAQDAVQEEALRSAYRWLTPGQIVQLSPAARREGLRGGLFSPSELTVDPRQVLQALPTWLERAYGVQLRFGAPVLAIQPPFLETPGESWQADHILVCSGPDLAGLYPQLYRQHGLTRCKLQMLRLAPPTAGWRLGPTLASGLTIARYDNFSGCPSIEALRGRLKREWPEQDAWGIHVLLAQNGAGELLVGDTHQYGQTFDPFDSERACQLILAYLDSFTSLPEPQVLERWHGIYPRLAGRSELVAAPEAGVTVVQITNGLGMTLSFGLAEEVLSRLV